MLPTSRASFRPKTRQLSLHVALALLCLRAAPAFRQPTRHRADSREGHRRQTVRAANRCGHALDPDQLYTVATNSFVIEPPRRESLIGTAKSVQIEEVLIRDLVIDYIKESDPIDALLPPTTTEERSSTESE